jgi:hypothetical protein
MIARRVSDVFTAANIEIAAKRFGKANWLICESAG